MTPSGVRDAVTASTPPSPPAASPAQPIRPARRNVGASRFLQRVPRGTRLEGSRELLESACRLEELVAVEVGERTLRAGSPKGWATWERFELDEAALATQRVVCFSETPLEHVHALFADIEGRSIDFAPYGLAFPKMVARWMGINPVWYIDLSRAPGEWRDWSMKEALNALVREATDDLGGHAISRLTPFIEGMGSWPNGNGGVRLREFSWEREWRHVGDIDLAPWWSKTLWLCPRRNWTRSWD